MSFPTPFVEPPKPEVEKLAKKLETPPLDSEDIQEYAKQQQETIQKEPEGKVVEQKTAPPPQSPKSVRPVPIKADPFPLKHEDEDQGQFSCQHCGNVTCKWCKEKAESEKDDNDNDDEE